MIPISPATGTGARPRRPTPCRGPARPPGRHRDRGVARKYLIGGTRRVLRWRGGLAAVLLRTRQNHLVRAARVVLVTGASRGIGRAVGLELARRGATVVGVARDPAALATLDAATGGTCLALDLTDPGAPGRAVTHCLDRYGRLDAVVVNAGIGYADNVQAMSTSDIVELVDLNVRASMLTARAALGPVRARPPGGPAAGLVFISSIAGAVGLPGESAYSATKAAIAMFAGLLREELRSDRIGVSVVIPGVVTTDLLTTRRTAYDRRFPRPVTPERVAVAVVDALESGAKEIYVPGWLRVPGRVAVLAPRLYRVMARRFG